MHKIQRQVKQQIKPRFTFFLISADNYAAINHPPKFYANRYAL